eukprot:CAMPEP_0119016610 /NCGR_PEP_ID=MMETSP1176-20130426/13797_1 /TAXON_ID=265551 /ORGANISM="Synedropsis recta cf, Strain CCMP1620" /LENGTH=321 /DNA_ID=CAMNT_0006970091 /DNA_START=63 /DNA_END=1028 /DNA_ORIENTATION=+
MVRSPVQLLLLTSCVVSLAQGFAPAAVHHHLRPTAHHRIASLKPPPSRTGTSARPALLDGAVGEIAKSLLQSEGGVPFIQSLGLNAFLFTALSSKLSTMLTPAGFGNSFVLATMLWTTLGWKGWSTCVAYLFMGQAVTKVRFAEKEAAGIAEGRGGRRGPGGVWGSALTGLMCALAASQGPSFLGISHSLYLLGYVASLATKLADTFASEIGKAYGKTTFLITTFERVDPGTEGAVSAEGSAASVVGGLLLALFGYGVGLITLPGVGIATVSAFLATNVESLIGATLQEKKGWEFMTNEVVNFINTLIGAAMAIFAGHMLL